MANNLGQQAKFLRIKSGLSLRDLADRTGASASTLSRFENGNLDIAYSTVLAIFDALGQSQQPTGFIVELTEAERDYLWLLTTLDALRVGAMESEDQQDYHYCVRHSVLLKLFG